MPHSKTLFVPPLIGIVSIILLIPLIFLDTTLAMAHVWTVNETFTHGYLIFPISLWLIWQKRNAIAQVQVHSEPGVFILLMPLLLLWFVGNTVDVQIAQQLAMIAMIPIIVWLTLGRRVLYAALFPLLFLFFAAPVGQSLIPVMMDFTAQFTITLIKIVGVPIYQDGLSFTLPTGSWSVVEECSGVRYLIASMALGTIYAYITYSSYYKRSVFILFAILIPILGNGLRAFGIVMLGHFSGMKLATGADHLIYGWIFFGFLIFAMFYIGSFWADPIEKQVKPTGEVAPQKLGFNTYLPGLLVIICLFSIKLVAYQMAQQQPSTPDNLSINLAEDFQGWQYAPEMSLGWTLDVAGADTTIERSYRFGGDLVQINIAFYHHQRQGAEAVSTRNRLTDPLKGRWKLIHSTEFQESRLYIRESELRKGEQKLLVWTWYRIGDKLTPNRYIAKLFDAYNQIFLDRQDASMITIATQFNLEKEISRKRLREFYGKALPKIYPVLEDLAR